MPPSELASLASIVYCRFPTQNGGGTLAHYALVIGVHHRLAQIHYELAYGSSKRVSVNGHLAHELVIWKPDDVRLANLRVPTRFDLTRRVTLPSSGCEVTGRMPQTPDLLRALRLAAIAAGLI